MATQSQEFVDGFVTFEQGLNSNVPPLLLPKTQLSFATNATLRNSFVSPRPSIRQLSLTFVGDIQHDFQTGLFQGKCEYLSDDGVSSEVWAISGKLYQVVPTGTSGATVSLVSTATTSQKADAPQHWLWQAEKWIIWNDGVNLPIFFNGSTCTRSLGRDNTLQILGQIINPLWQIPPVGSTTIVLDTLAPHNLVIGQKVTIFAGSFVIASIVSPTSFTMTTTATNAPNAYVGWNGQPGNAIYIYFNPNTAQLPVGRMGVYGRGRIWICLPDGKQFIAGDLVGGSSGTIGNNFRDAVLNVTENVYLYGGGNFTVPGSVGSITAMRFTATLDASLGQGPLQVFTPTTVFSCNAPVDRLTWQNLQNPILTESLIGNGALGQNSTRLANGDTIFRSVDGLRSLILARREFDTWGNVPISREVQRVIDQDDPDLLAYGSAVQFNNRFLMTCKPTASDSGVFHQGLIALNFDPLSNLAGKKPSLYDGLWTGLNILQIDVSSNTNGQRCIISAYNAVEKKIEMWELLNDGDSTSDNGVPIVWEFETGLLFKDSKKGLFDPVELDDGEININNLVDRADFRVYYRPDNFACWTLWNEFSICNDFTSTQRAYQTRIGLGQPSISDCDSTGSGKPFRIGNYFQIKVVIQGYCVFQGLKAKAHLEPKPYWAKPVCKCPSLPVPKTITYRFVGGELQLLNPANGEFIFFGVDNDPAQLFIDIHQTTKAKLESGYLQVLNPDDGLWYAVTSNEDPPQFQLQPFNQLTVASPSYYKIDGSNLYLKNPTTKKYHRMSIGGSPAQLQLDFVGIE